MKKLSMRLAAATILALACGAAAHAADHLITFEEPGLTAMSNSPGSAVPAGSQLHDQFLGIGVSFSSGAGFVAVVNHGCCTASVPNIIGGTTSGGALSYGTPITITFFDPADTTAPGITDFVQIRGDFIPIPGTATMNAYDALGGLLGSVTRDDVAAGVDLNLSFAGIHSVMLSQTSATIGLDNFAFDNVTAVPTTPAIPEPETYALMLAGLGALGWVARRRRR